MRTPQYTKDREYRIVSFPSGMWRLQRDSGVPGTKEADNWQDRSPLMGFVAALALLQQHEAPPSLSKKEG